MSTVVDMIRTFLDTGGPVLWAILLLSVLLWGLIAERFLYFNFIYPELREHWRDEWMARTDKRSPRAFSVRRCMISEARLVLGKTVILIKTLIGLCPLLGLLGTVTGMISVFDVLAVTGTGNARAMATGVSRATIPTMAGMVIAIAGLYFSKRVEERVESESRVLSEILHHD